MGVAVGVAMHMIKIHKAKEKFLTFVDEKCWADKNKTKAKNFKWNL